MINCTTSTYMEKLITLIAVIALAGSAAAETLPVTYNFKDAEPTGYRKIKTKPSHDTETLDVAIYIDGNLAGKKVTSISVPLMGDLSTLDSFQAFITTRLATKNCAGEKVNDPDICTVEATLDGNTLTAVFNEPYTITDKGVYVGYSMTDRSMKNEIVAQVPEYTEGGFWYRGSEGNPKWIDIGMTSGTSSALTVYVEGDFATADVKALPTMDVYAQQGEASFTTVSLFNYGLTKVESIGYSVTVDGTTQSYTTDIVPAADTKLGFPFTASIEIPPMIDLGNYEVEVSIDKVNGIDNAALFKTVKCGLKSLPFLPKNNPLVEEYTGLNCGWCPQGYVVLRQMHDRYGIENFVAISYHYMLESGCMVHLYEFPYNPSGIPTAQINRKSELSVGKIPEAWDSWRHQLASGETEVSLSWTDESKTEMTAKARTRFLDDNDDAPYLVSFCVVADGLSNPNWEQYNGFASMSEEEKAAYDNGEGYWNLFLSEDAGSNVKDLVFDDIAVLYTDQQGITGSLPTKIESGKWYESSFSFKPAEILNTRGENVINDPEKLRVIAIIHDTESKSVVNSASSLYADGSGSADTVIEDPEGEAVYYNFNGMRVSNPSEGIYIRIQGGKATKVIL